MPRVTSNASEEEKWQLLRKEFVVNSVIGMSGQFMQRDPWVCPCRCRPKFQQMRMQMQGLGSELSGPSKKKHNHLNRIVRAPRSQRNS